MTAALTDAAAIVGIAQSRFARGLPETEEFLAATVIRDALADVVAWRSRKRGDRSRAPWMNTQARVRSREAWTR